VASGQPLKARGSALADFEPLRPAERLLLQACRDGTDAVYGAGKRPTERPPDQKDRLRAAFVRFLCLCGDDRAPIHARGVRMRGAWIETDGGTLDLAFTTLPFAVVIKGSVIEGEVRLQHAQGKAVDFSGSLVPGIKGDGLQLDGSLDLANKFHSTGEVLLVGAMIGGNLVCRNGRFENAGGHALSCDGASIKGDVFLDDRFHAKGEVRLLGATIGGDLYCDNGWFQNAGGPTLSCDRASIKGDVLLNNGFHARGEVRLLGATIGGDLNCNKGRFENAGGLALSGSGASIANGFLFCDLYSVTGGLDLSHVTARIVFDDAKSWRLGGPHVLTGFRYDSIAGPTDTAMRVAWLQLQRADHLTSDFQPQPWTQLIKVLRRMGYGDGADEVAIAFQEQRRTAGRVRTRAGRLLHRMFGLLAGYGYKPMRLLGVMLGVWLACGFLYWAMALRGGFGPSSPLVFDAAIYDHCRPARAEPPRNDKPHVGNWYWCPDLAGEYTTFQPWLYSLDLILPLVDLQQDKDWSPIIPTPRRAKPELGMASHLWLSLRDLADVKMIHPIPPDGGRVPWSAWTAGQFARALMWFEILFGWVASLLLVATLTGFTNRERQDAD